MEFWNKEIYLNDKEFFKMYFKTPNNELFIRLAQKDIVVCEEYLNRYKDNPFADKIKYHKDKLKSAKNILKRELNKLKS